MNSPSAPTINDEAYWEAVIAKDRHYDGRFVTAVRSTHIYCRPSCPARTPHRENVVFYLRPDEAEAAGFCPCKRCSPNTQAYEAEIAERVCRYIDAHLGERLKLDELGAVVALSPQHLQRVFKRALGISPREYLDARRMEHLKGRLKAGESVTNALYDAGFSSTSRLYERAQGTMGMTPADYRNGAKDLHIRYVVATCSLGYALVATTERGICAVTLGDTPEAVVKALQADFPSAVIEAEGSQLAEPLQTVLEYLEGHQPHFELPLDIRGTAFQQRVWQELRAIPAGETRSYSQIAAAIGKPDATRAVARACATNHIAVVIPCHRVVRQDGAMGGYKWGLPRKTELLRREQSQE